MMSHDKFVTLREEMLYLFFRSYDIEASFSFWKKNLLGKYHYKNCLLLLKELTFHSIRYSILGKIDLFKYLPSPEKDSDVQWLLDFKEALDFSSRNGFSVFNLNVPFSKWWDGPHLPFKEKPIGWCAGKITSIEGDIAGAIVGELMEGEPTFGHVDLTKEYLEKGGVSFDSLKKPDYHGDGGDYFEIHEFTEGYRVVLSPERELYIPFPVEREKYVPCSIYEYIVEYNPSFYLGDYLGV